MADYIYIMESRLTPEQQRGVKLVQDVARMHEMNIHLVGGVVRDIISGATIRDLDFAVVRLNPDTTMIANDRASTHPTDSTYLADSTFSNFTLAAVAFGIAARW